MPVRVIIVDDHGILRAGLYALLNGEPGIEVIGEASSGEEGLQLVAQNPPDVVLMDISMPGISGLEATRLIRSRYPGTRVLILTIHDDKALLQEALQAGAGGYILKRAVKSELLSAIQAVAKGDLYIHPSMTRALLTEVSSGQGAENGSAQAAEPELLTRRELEVLQLIVQGHTSSQIAEKLNISPRTVEFHRANIMSKLNIKNRVGLVRYAAENGLLG
jgi:two-component system, NarL family, response regulator NreC